ncbi:hypothetical protein HYH02_005195 [Chlamydomonas schloesseri]|uniref:RING-type domain-containing protein n=1 Tax=Chlamydomonas schloesseri TaxID=2026947 RepID=A0A835WLL2_9CHLO|nr:hypothetical protein HYH02_005195 [Chlamydomonas schloesseri]|eukprot:KAG2449666.1 hypothetical protein HYH02_005195 [Chlamydomonas schloesseri]
MEVDPKPEQAVELCVRCHKEPIKYMTLPCRHKTLCTHCAARVATGGKCFVCHQFFSKLKHIPEPGEEAEEDTEEEEEGGGQQGGDDEEDEDEGNGVVKA